jgi:hypothetical protein
MSDNRRQHEGASKLLIDVAPRFYFMVAQREPFAFDDIFAAPSTIASPESIVIWLPLPASLFSIQICVCVASGPLCLRSVTYRTPRFGPLHIFARCG